MAKIGAIQRLKYRVEGRALSFGGERVQWIIALASELEPRVEISQISAALPIPLEGKLAAELDPLSPEILLDTVFALAWQGNYEAAMEQANRAMDLDAAFFLPCFAQGWINIAAGEIGDAIPELQKANVIESPLVRCWLARICLWGDRRPHQSNGSHRGAES
jgi:tetratricopeptide (TPR) repeat protein